MRPMPWVSRMDWIRPASPATMNRPRKADGKRRHPRTVANSETSNRRNDSTGRTGRSHGITGPTQRTHNAKAPAICQSSTGAREPFEVLSYCFT